MVGRADLETDLPVRVRRRVGKDRGAGAIGRIVVDDDDLVEIGNGRVEVFDQPDDVLDFV